SAASVPGGVALRPRREPEANPVALVASEPGRERSLVVHRSPPRIAALPEAAHPCQFAGGKVGIVGEGTSEPPQQRGQRKYVIPVVLEDPGQGRGAPMAEEIEVERRDQVAGDVVLTDETEELSLQRP